MISNYIYSHKLSIHKIWDEVKVILEYLSFFPYLNSLELITFPYTLKMSHTVLVLNTS